MLCGRNGDDSGIGGFVLVMGVGLVLLVIVLVKVTAVVRVTICDTIFFTQLYVRCWHLLVW